MAKTPSPSERKRPYDSSRRLAQAHRSRSKVIESAYKVFVERGYAGATIETIAQDAGVAPETIYAAFGNKRELLGRVISYAVGGDAQEVPVAQRPEQQAVLQMQELRPQIHGFAQGIAMILERVAPVFEILRPAAKTDVEIAALLQGLLAERLRNMENVARHFAANGRLRLEETRASETLWVLTSPELYRTLTLDRGWTRDVYATWLADSLERLLVADE